MTSFHSLTFNITGVPGGISPGHPLWTAPLAGRSSEFSAGPCPWDGGWTIGGYFSAARAFISTPGVKESLAGFLGSQGSSYEDWDVVLDLQKHGAFYHPVKVTISIRGASAGKSLVLNGAVSPHGRELAEKEGALFSWLEDRLPFPATPRVIAAGEVNLGPGPAGFLMAQWLEGYHEFHLTGSGQVVVWRPGAGDLYLALEDALPAYENIARILTLAYDLDSGNQLLFWHHAAGDFILAPDQPNLPVKLITARACGSLVDEEILAQGPMPGLLFFFVNLCLRMQMDRLDGVGDPVFLGPGVLAATLKGFFKGLGAVAGDGGKEMVQGVWEFFSSFREKEMEMILEQVVEAWPPGPSERDLVSRQMPVLACRIRALFKSERFCDFY